MKTQRILAVVLLLAVVRLVGEAQWFQIPQFAGKWITSLLVKDSVVIVGGYQKTLYRSTDHGSSWTNIIGIIQADTIFSLGALGDYVFVGTSSGVYRSLDYGSSWTKASSGMVPSPPFINEFETLGTVLFAATDYGLYRTMNYGSLWTGITAGLPTGANRRMIAVVSKNGDLYAIGGIKQGAYCSRDSGGTWAGCGLAGKWGYDLAVLDTNVFAATGNGVFLFSGSDTSWISRNNGLTNEYIFSLRVVDGVLFAGSGTGRVFRSTDLGQTWTEVNDAVLFGSTVSAITSDTLNVYAAAHNGLWSRPLAELKTSVPDDGVGPPSTFGLEQNFPNPFNPSTTIRYHLPRESRVRLEVFNLLGERVSVLVDQMRQAGTYAVRFDATNLPSGVYFYRLQTGTSFQVKKLVLMW